MIRGVFILFAAVAAFAAVPAKSFFVRPSADSLVFFRVDSIVVQNGDAFDDSKAYSWADSLVYRIGNTIHIETRESVVKKLVLFDVGDSVNLYELIESEKNLRSQAYIADASAVSSAPAYVRQRMTSSAVGDIQYSCMIGFPEASGI